MELVLVILPSPYSSENKGNLILPWTPGTNLSDALSQMFSQAYSNMPISINIGSNLVSQNDMTHHDFTLEGMAYKVNDLAKGIF
jgi:hypothetical protein